MCWGGGGDEDEATDDCVRVAVGVVLECDAASLGRSDGAVLSPPELIGIDFEGGRSSPAPSSSCWPLLMLVLAPDGDLYAMLNQARAPGEEAPFRLLIRALVEQVTRDGKVLQGRQSSERPPHFVEPGHGKLAK